MFIESKKLKIKKTQTLKKKGSDLLLSETGVRKEEELEEGIQKVQTCSYKYGDYNAQHGD